MFGFQLAQLVMTILYRLYLNGSTKGGLYGWYMHGEGLLKNAYKIYCEVDAYRTEVSNFAWLLGNFKNIITGKQLLICRSGAS